MLIANYEPHVYQGIANVEGAPPVRMILRPGLNEIDAETFAVVSKEAGPARRLESGQIAEVKRTGSLPPKMATDLAALTSDLDVLERWHAAEKREPVRLAIESQIKALQPNAEAERDARRYGRG